VTTTLSQNVLRVAADFSLFCQVHCVFLSTLAVFELLACARSDWAERWELYLQ